MNRELDYRAGTAELETRSGHDVPAIVGYAALWYDASNPGSQWDVRGDGSIYERVRPEAFDGIEKADVLALLEHRFENLLGRTTAGTLTLTRDAKGLRYWIDPPVTALGKQVSESLRRGDLKGSSFGMRKMERVPKYEGRSLILEIRSADVAEVTITAFPSYKGTLSELSRRSIQAFQTGRDLDFEQARLKLMQMRG